MTHDLGSYQVVGPSSSQDGFVGETDPLKISGLQKTGPCILKVSFPHPVQIAKKVDGFSPVFAGTKGGGAGS